MRQKIFVNLICMLLITGVLFPIAGTSNIDFNDEKVSRLSFKENGNKNIVPGEFFIKFVKGAPLFFEKHDNIILTGIDSLDQLNEKYGIYNAENTFLHIIPKPKNTPLASGLYSGKNAPVKNGSIIRPSLPAGTVEARSSSIL